MIPAFASFPVNDRMIYGPYVAVKIWAAERWERYQHHVFTVLPTIKSEAGAGLHDERMVKYSIIPAIRNEVDVEVMEDRSLFFLHVRANGNIWMEDSSKSTDDERKIVKTKLELSLQRKCGEPFQIMIGSIKSYVLLYERGLFILTGRSDVHTWSERKTVHA